MIIVEGRINCVQKHKGVDDVRQVGHCLCIILLRLVLAISFFVRYLDVGEAVDPLDFRGLLDLPDIKEDSNSSWAQDHHRRLVL